MGAKFSERRCARRGFSLLELIVVLLVVAVIAVIAIPTFQAVVVRAQDRATLVAAQALMRDAAALASFRGGAVFEESDLEGVVSELGASAPAPVAAAGVTASPSGGWVLTLDPDEYSSSYGVISGGFNGPPV